MTDDDLYKHKNDKENNKIQQSQDLTQKIIKLKEKLNNKIEGNSKDLINEEILKLSCELDVLILEFMSSKKL